MKLAAHLGALGRRARKARATRQCIIGAAEVLFVRDGYTATTIEVIAGEADVAVQTVYAVFGNKRAILIELMNSAVGGDDDDHTPLTERPEWLAMQAESRSPPGP